MKTLSLMVIALSFPSIVAAQGDDPGLVVPVPPKSRVAVIVDSFTTPMGERRELQIIKPKSGDGAPFPVVAFANNSGPALMRARAHQEWARLVTTRGTAGLVYEGGWTGPQLSAEESARLATAFLDSAVAAVSRRRLSLGVDPSRLVVWAASGMTWTGTPFALSGDRQVNGYVLYYGAGAVAEPRIDVPVLMVRAGLDSPGLNAQFDSLARRLTLAGSPVTVISHPAGTHGFDLADSSATTSNVITQTLDFIERVNSAALHVAIRNEMPEAEAAAALAAGHWVAAERAYQTVAARKPNSRSVHWKLGIAQLGNGHPADALLSFDRAKALGQGGARDIGIPAIRAAVRSANTPKAAEWAAWALRSYPRIQAEIAADSEIAGVLALPSVKTP